MRARPTFWKTRQLLGPLLAMRPALRRAYGWTWPLAVVRCLRRGRTLILATRWANRGDEEARHVRALSLLPALYLDARQRLNERSLEFVRELAAAVLDAQTERVARQASLFEIADPSERWHVFFGRTVSEGTGAFNENECLSVEPDRFHLRVLRCVYAELAQEIGTPELAHLLCDLRTAFCRRLLPSYEFHRAGSAQNTLAHGHACCEYVWERPDSRPVCASLEADDRRSRCAAAPGSCADGIQEPSQEHA